MTVLVADVAGASQPHRASDEFCAIENGFYHTAADEPYGAMMGRNENPIGP